MGWGIGLGRGWLRGRYAFFHFWLSSMRGEREGEVERGRRQEENGRRTRTRSI
jgi:hypothetical protein